MDIMHEIIMGNTVVAVGHHHGFEIGPDTMLFESEKYILSQLSPRKKSEWLASQELLFRVAKLPNRAECLYDDFGKPHLKGIDKDISISHSERWCSVIVSDISCGVDIQVYRDTVQRISNRFLSDIELTEIEKKNNKLHYLHVYWGAKECIYKAYGKRKLEFRSHIFITSIDPTQCTAVGEIRYEDIHLTYDIHYRILPEAAWVFCMQHPVPISSHQSRL